MGPLSERRWNGSTRYKHAPTVAGRMLVLDLLCTQGEDWLVPTLLGEPGSLIFIMFFAFMGVNNFLGDPGFVNYSNGVSLAWKVGNLVMMHTKWH